MAGLSPLIFGDIDDVTRPLAVLVHGFPDTPYTWRHLGPMLVDRGSGSVLIGHDWGAHAGYGAVVSDPGAYARLVTLAVPPTNALGESMFSYQQLKRSFYIWFIQQVGLAEFALLQPGFWESLWADWSPGYDATDDIARLRAVATEATIGDGQPVPGVVQRRVRRPRGRGRGGRHDDRAACAHSVHPRDG